MILRKQVINLTALTGVHTDALDNLSASNRMLAEALDDHTRLIAELRIEVSDLRAEVAELRAERATELHH